MTSCLPMWSERLPTFWPAAGIGTLLLLAGFATAVADFKTGFNALMRGEFDTARVILTPVAEKGDAQAQFYLGRIYAWGGIAAQNHPEAVPQNPVEAVCWLRKAAEQGLARAQSLLGGQYARGQGVPRDDEEAYAWLNLAAAQGDQGAAKTRDHVSQRMTPDARARAQRRSKQYWKAYVEPFPP